MSATWRREIELITDVEPIDPPRGFYEHCEAFGIALDPQEIAQLGRYAALLLANNARVNLTGVKDPGELWARHIFDALTPIAVLAELAESIGSEPAVLDAAYSPSTAGSPRLKLSAPPLIADVGSGGGLPAVVLAVVMPSVDIVMIEATSKKAAFLAMLIDRLGLPNAGVVCERAETLGQDDQHRERYDAVTARAVGPLRVIAELCTPLARVGGHAVLLKGQRAEEELAEAKPALHTLHATHEATLDTPTGKLVVLSKGRPTPRAYPRRPGEPKRQPL